MESMLSLAYVSVCVCVQKLTEMGAQTVEKQLFAL